MELRFNATDVVCVEENDVRICGASNSKSDEPCHYIMFQQWVDPDFPDDEQRPHFEIDDQINGEYDLLGACSISRDELTVQVLHGVPWYPDLQKIVVGIGNVTTAEFDSFVAGMKCIYRDRSSDLQIQLSDGSATLA